MQCRHTIGLANLLGYTVPSIPNAGKIWFLNILGPAYQTAWCHNSVDQNMKWNGLSFFFQINVAKLHYSKYCFTVAWPTTVLRNMCAVIQVSESILSVHSVQVKHWRQMVIYTVYSDTVYNN
jgi:hypothetical protein